VSQAVTIEQSGATMSVASSLPEPGVFLTWGVFGIQLGNLILIAVMLALFVLALVLPFPGRVRR
jgi:hypothetical protein